MSSGAPKTVASLCLLLATAGCGELAAIERSVNGPPSKHPSAPSQPTPEPALEAKFIRTKGAPELAPLPVTDVTAFDFDDTLPPGLQKSRDDVSLQKGFPTPDDPHRMLGVVLLRGSKSAGWGERVAVLRAEAAKHGANAIVSKGCRSAGDTCAAVAFHLSSASPPAAQAPKGPSDAEIAAAIAAQIPGATVIVNKNATGGAPSPAQIANRAAAEAVLAAAGAGAPNKTAIPNNKALITALLGLWMPGPAGSAAGSPSTVFERELLRSVVYVETAGGKPKLTTEGLLIALTDEKSADSSVKLVAVPATRLLELAAKNKIGIYLHHEGDASVFTGLTLERIGEILTQAGKKAR